MTEEQELMELAEEKIRNSRILLQNKGYADSVSRSYYAMLNAAKALLKTKDSSPKTHQGINSELGKLFRDEIDKELLRSFSKIQSRREDADYTNTDIEKQEAEEILETAQEFYSKAEEYLAKR